MLCGVAEYDELPVRHNEDVLNMTLSAQVRFPIKAAEAEDPHAKASLLLQASPTAMMAFSLVQAHTVLEASSPSLPACAQSAASRVRISYCRKRSHMEAERRDMVAGGI